MYTFGSISTYNTILETGLNQFFKFWNRFEIAFGEINFQKSLNILPKANQSG